MVGTGATTQSWLSPKLDVGASRIEGLGLIATAAIAEGEVCAVMGGQVLSDLEFAAFIATADRWSAAAIGEGLNLLQSDDDPLRYGNHSCDPNMWMTNEVTLVARSPIAAAEEATVDYALMTVDSTWHLDCRCGAAVCRRIVRGDDWRLPALQARYGTHFSPFIAARIVAASKSGA